MQTRSITIEGNLVNNGTITDSNYDFYIYIAVTLLITEFLRQKNITLLGTSKQFLSGTSVIASSNFVDQDNSSPAELASDLSFSGTTFDFNFLN